MDTAARLSGPGPPGGALAAPGSDRKRHRPGHGRGHAGAPGGRPGFHRRTGNRGLDQRGRQIPDPGSAGRGGDDPGRTPGLHHSDRAGHDQFRRRGRGRLPARKRSAAAGGSGGHRARHHPRGAQPGLLGAGHRRGRAGRDPGHQHHQQSGRQGGRTGGHASGRSGRDIEDGPPGHRLDLREQRAADRGRRRAHRQQSAGDRRQRRQPRLGRPQPQRHRLRQHGPGPRSLECRVGDGPARRQCGRALRVARLQRGRGDRHQVRPGRDRRHHHHGEQQLRRRVAASPGQVPERLRRRRHRRRLQLGRRPRRRRERRGGRELGPASRRAPLPPVVVERRCSALAALPDEREGVLPDRPQTSRPTSPSPTPPSAPTCASPRCAWTPPAWPPRTKPSARSWR